MKSAFIHAFGSMVSQAKALYSPGGIPPIEKRPSPSRRDAVLIGPTPARRIWYKNDRCRIKGLAGSVRYGAGDLASIKSELNIDRGTIFVLNIHELFEYIAGCGTRSLDVTIVRKTGNIEADSLLAGRLVRPPYHWFELLRPRSWGYAFRAVTRIQTEYGG